MKKWLYEKARSFLAKFMYEQYGINNSYKLGPIGVIVEGKRPQGAIVNKIKFAQRVEALEKKYKSIQQLERELEWIRRQVMAKEPKMPMKPPKGGKKGGKKGC